MDGRARRFACVGWSVCSFTPTSRSSRNLRARCTGNAIRQLWRRSLAGVVEPSYGLKLNRALEHLEALDHAVKRWAETDPCAISFESDVATRQQTLTQRVIRQPSDPLLPLLIGDIVHNMRQGLDHLAYRLAIKVRGTDPPPNWQSSMWPITTKAKLQGRITNDVAPENDMPPGMYAAIKGFQTDAGSDGELLALLHALDNGDKHRFPPLIAGMAQSVQLGGGFTATGNVNIGNAIYAQRVEAGTIEVGPFDDGKVIARADEIIVQGDMDVHVRPAASIAFAKTYDAAPGELVLPLLKAIHDAITNRLFPTMEQFL